MSFLGYHINSDPCESEQDAWQQWLDRFTAFLRGRDEIGKLTWRVTPRLVDNTDFDSAARQFSVFSRITEER